MADGRSDYFPAPVGERLRRAREKHGLSLDDIATQTRVPVRHLEAIENGEWANLPAPTYSIGFAKSFAEAVGLDRQEIGDELRVEMGGARAAATETHEAADPARVPPRMLAISAFVIAVLLVGGYFYWRSAALGDVQPNLASPEETAPGASLDTRTPVTPLISGPVVITANEPVWVKVSERGGKSIMETTLGAGQSYEVPASALDPVLRTGRAELLRVSVGTADAPPLGPPSTLVKDVSLRPAALLALNRAPPVAPTAPPPAP